MVDPQRHATKRNAGEELLRDLPGFRGYLEKEYRRESDALLRKALAERVERGKRGLDAWARAEAEAGRLSLLPQVDRVRGRLDHLLGRVRSAMQGYSGVFDLVKVDEGVLERVYQHDQKLLVDFEGLAAMLAQFSIGSSELAADRAVMLADCLNKIEQLQQGLDARSDLLRGLD